MTEESASLSFLMLILSILIIIQAGVVALLVLDVFIPSSDKEASPGEIFSFTGIATWIEYEGGFWGFIDDDGNQYLPINLPPDTTMDEGQRVVVTAVPAEVSTFPMRGAPIRVIQMVSQVPGIASLVDTRWVLHGMREDEILGSMPPGVRVTLAFLADGSIKGNAPVNQYFGQYVRKEEAITLSQIGSTLMAGSPGTMELEARYLSHLQEVRSYEIRDRFLMLKNSEGSALLLYHADGVFI